MLCSSDAAASTCETESPRALDAKVVGAPDEDAKHVVDPWDGEVVFCEVRGGQTQGEWSGDSYGHSLSYQVSATEGVCNQVPCCTDVALASSDQVGSNHSDGQESSGTVSSSPPSPYSSPSKLSSYSHYPI